MWLPSAPGETIADIINEEDIDMDTLADVLRLDHAQLEALIDGKLPIDANLAGRLSAALGSTPEFWERREAHYRLALSGGNVPFAQMCDGLLDVIETTRNDKETGV